jgi:hypothetical protein
MWNIQYLEFDYKSLSLFCDIAQFGMKTSNLSTLFRIWSLLHILGISVVTLILCFQVLFIVFTRS